MLQPLLLYGIVAVVCLQAAQCAGRVVQLIAENPSSFVAADPNAPQYVVTLFNEGNMPTELPQAELARHMMMTDAAGQRYNCSVPSRPSQFSSEVSHQQQGHLQHATLPTRTPFELLDSLTGLCLYRQDGLWTYEVCHKKHVRQFRQGLMLQEGVSMLKVSDASSFSPLMNAVAAGDMARAAKELDLLMGTSGSGPDAAKGKEDFSCGSYTGDDQQTEAILEDSSSSGHNIKYVSHTFGGGADCILTGAPRTAEVRYTCARDTKENVVLSVREFPSCNYVVVVSTPFLCKHPAFMPGPQDVRLISCLPVDEQGEAVIKELQALRGAAAGAATDAQAGVVPTSGREGTKPSQAAASPSRSDATAASSGDGEQKQQRQIGAEGVGHQPDEL